MAEKEKSKSQAKPTVSKPIPPGLIPIDSTHFRKIPIIGHINAK